MIICKDLSKLFGGRPGIREVNLSFSPGIIYGIIGYNGAGKTTLLRCIEGVYQPSAGSVYHNDISTRQTKAFLPCRRRIAFLPADDFLYGKLTCVENIELATILRTGQNKLLTETEKLLDYFETRDFLDKRFCDCSTGMKKKIQIIASLVGDIDTIIWDEPNDGLDIISNIKIKSLLNHYKQKNVTILFSCHVLEFLNGFIDYCVLIKGGTIAESLEADKIASLEDLYLGYSDKQGVAFDASSAEL
ncbi:MAG: ABC transporter ATP-binding protein [Treponema sp.]|jgi:ABC-type multidrug transport system ATPase subunit|nr:ABC transporter ATP-binding protein [Treponema sp.]